MFLSLFSGGFPPPNHEFVRGNDAAELAFVATPPDVFEFSRRTPDYQILNPPLYW